MNSSPSEWEFVGAVPDGKSFYLGGIDVWQHPWRDTKSHARVIDPHYHREFTFSIYEIAAADRVVRFAAGEFSNCIWGFYIPRPPRIVDAQSTC